MEEALEHIMCFRSLFGLYLVARRSFQDKVNETVWVILGQISFCLRWWHLLLLMHSLNGHHFATSLSTKSDYSCARLSPYFIPPCMQHLCLLY